MGIKQNTRTDQLFFKMLNNTIILVKRKFNENFLKVQFDLLKII